jgi:hypothetical protein
MNLVHLLMNNVDKYYINMLKDKYILWYVLHISKKIKIILIE